jgi:hypothetical protein
MSVIRTGRRRNCDHCRRRPANCRTRSHEISVTNSRISVACDTFSPVYLTPSRAGQPMPGTKGTSTPYGPLGDAADGRRWAQHHPGTQLSRLGESIGSHNSAAGTRRCFGHFFVRAARVSNMAGSKPCVFWRRWAPQLAAPSGRGSATFSPRLDVRDAGPAAAGRSVGKVDVRAADRLIGSAQPDGAPPGPAVGSHEGRTARIR